MTCACESTAMGGVDGGECDAAITLGKWPSDVDALKRRIDLQVEALELGVKDCRGFDAADRQAWALFLATWRAYAAKETGLWGVANEWITACSYAHVVDAWRTKFAAKCATVPGPDPISGADTSGLKWMAAAVVAVAVVGGGIYAARFLR